jgi:preprotein translocase subunit SecY
MVGILARFPQAFIQEFTTRLQTITEPMLWLSDYYWLLVIIACVL